MTKRHTILFACIAVFIAASTILLIYQFRRSLLITTQVENTPLVSDAFYPLPITADDPTMGNPGAEFEVVEFIDLGNSASKVLHTILTTFTRAHPKQIRLVWKDYPKQSIFLGNNNTAHMAAWCAYKQNKFWEFTDALTKDSSNLKPKGLEKVATDLKLDIPQWQQCVVSTEADGHIKTNLATAEAAGIAQAPALFINSKRINVAEVDVEQMLNSIIAQ